jgi:hypothetical protein
MSLGCEMQAVRIDFTCRLHMYSYKNCLDDSFAKELPRLPSLLLLTADTSPGDSYSTAAALGCPIASIRWLLRDGQESGQVALPFPSPLCVCISAVNSRAGVTSRIISPPSNENVPCSSSCLP